MSNRKPSRRSISEAQGRHFADIGAVRSFCVLSGCLSAIDKGPDKFPACKKEISPGDILDSSLNENEALARMANVAPNCERVNPTGSGVER